MVVSQEVCKKVIDETATVWFLKESQSNRKDTHDDR